MPLSLGSDNELWRLVDELKRPFGNRDSKWLQRRKIRFRQMEKELASLPLNPSISQTALMVYQTEVPNQEIHKRVKRLVANPARFEVIVYDDNPGIQRLGQDLEDGIKAVYKWMNRGKSSWEWGVSQNQQGDGLGIGKIEWVPGHGDVLGYYDEDDLQAEDEDTGGALGQGRNEARQEYREALGRTKAGDSDRETTAYDEITEAALKKEKPPVRLIKVDPITCYWWEDDDGIEIMVETGKRQLNPLLETFQSYGLKVNEDGSRLVVTPGDMEAFSSGTTPEGRSGGVYHSRTGGSYGNISQQVDYIELRTRHEIIIMIEHPKITDKGPTREDGGKGVVLRFSNPFGPYTTGYALIPGDETTENDPADKYQPPALAAINSAQAQNVLVTSQLSAALEDALSPKYIKTSPDTPMTPSEEDKTPRVEEGQEIPMVPGEIKRIESPETDLERIDARITADAQVGGFQEVLEGSASSEATGHRLAIQVSQADIQMVPYQNARAEAIKELMKGLLYAVRKHGLTIYIPTIPDGPRTSGETRVADHAQLTPEMADLNFELIVTLGAETPVTKYAKWQALRDREEAGTVGYQTVIEQSDVENPEDEIKRVFQGKLLKAVMEQSVPMIAQSIMAYVQAKLFPPLAPGGGGEAGGMAVSGGANPATGLAGGGGPIGPVAGEDFTRLPGVNMPVNQTIQGGPGAGAPDVAGLGAI